MRLSLWFRTIWPAVFLLFLPACTKKESGSIPDVKFGQTVRGKVTYKGKPVPYGFVLLYSPERSLDVKTGQMAPAAVSNIGKDGSYELKNAPSGPVVFCIASDPDVQPVDLVQPSRMGKGARPHEPPGGPPSGPGFPPGAPGSQSTGGPPGMPPDRPPGPPPVGPPGPGSGGHRRPPRFPGADVNPLTKDLSKDDKKMLKEIHKKYAAFGRSPLTYVVELGEQTFDLKLE
jgi:hypothetical protein